MNFTVFGVARSGTTALAKAINLHPKLLCTVESIAPHKSLKNLTFPDAFFDESIVGKQSEKNQTNYAAKEHPLVGSKFPRYFLYLDRINTEIAHVKHIGIYRESFGFADSWERRVQAKSQWQPGRATFAGILEQLVFFKSLLKPHDKENIHIFSYDLLFYKDNKHISKVYEALDVEAEPHTQTFEKQIFRKRPIPDNTVTNEVEEAAKALFSITAFDEFIKENSGRPLGKNIQEVATLVDEMDANLDTFFAEFAKKLSSDEVSFIKSQAQIFQTNYPKLSGLMETLSD